MTRWARGEKSNRKKEHDATSWQDFKPPHSSGEAPDQHRNERQVSYTDRVKKKTRKGTSKFRLEEKKNLSFFNGCGESDSEDDRIIFVGPADERKPGIAAELEKLGSCHAQKGTLSGEQKNVSTEYKNKPGKSKWKPMKGLLKTELTERLCQLKKEKGLEQEDLGVIEGVIHKDQRRERRRLKRKGDRLDSKVCFNCRQKGHTMEECTEKKDVETADGICYKCGSTEHSLKKCKAKVPSGHFPYAKCFICGEQGHLSSMCPDNPKGLYPKGGCCRICASVEHYKKDCPEIQKRSGIEEYVAATVLATGSVDDDSFVIKKKETVHTIPKKKPKVVKF